MDRVKRAMKLSVVGGKDFRVKIYCDVCGEPITDGGLALVRWHRKEAVTYEVPSSEVTVCHKGACDKFLDIKVSDDPWMELTRVLDELLLDLNFDPRMMEFTHLKDKPRPDVIQTF
jgi:hypothetical protein